MVNVKLFSPRLVGGGCFFLNLLDYETLQPMNQGTEIQQEFYKELKELLIRYDAELLIDNFGSGWLDDYRMVVDFAFNPERCTVPQLDLGTWEDGTV